MRHAQLHLVSRLVESPLRAAGPDILVVGPYQTAPGALIIDGEGVFVLSVVDELLADGVPPI